jgi:hypothetical protein
MSAQLELLCPPCNPTSHECVLELLKLSSNVNEIKPLISGETDLAVTPAKAAKFYRQILGQGPA